jgi:hypothetical protein
MSQRNILSINVGIGDGQNVQHKSRLNVQGSNCHKDKMLQWTFWLGQNITVDVVNLDVSSRHPPKVIKSVRARNLIHSLPDLPVGNTSASFTTLQNVFFSFSTAAGERLWAVLQGDLPPYFNRGLGLLSWRPVTDGQTCLVQYRVSPNFSNKDLFKSVKNC